jgi:hypothetical protein
MTYLSTSLIDDDAASFLEQIEYMRTNAEHKKRDENIP